MRRRLARVIMALLVVASFSAVSAPKADAHFTLAFKWPQPQMYFCQSASYPFPNATMWDTTRQGIIYWNRYGYGQPKFIEVSDSGLCDYRVEYRNVSGGNLARSSFAYSSSGVLLYVTTYINAAATNSMWWSGAYQNCYVGVAPGCKVDVFTLELHESAHAIGLRHNTSASIQRCTPWGWSNAAIERCDVYGEAAMHWNAGSEFINGYFGASQYPHQGYRHYPTADDLAALAQY